MPEGSLQLEVRILLGGATTEFYSLKKFSVLKPLEDLDS